MCVYTIDVCIDNDVFVKHWFIRLFARLASACMRFHGIQEGAPKWVSKWLRVCSINWSLLNATALEYLVFANGPYHSLYCVFHVYILCICMTVNAILIYIQEQRNRFGIAFQHKTQLHSPCTVRCKTVCMCAHANVCLCSTKIN